MEKTCLCGCGKPVKHIWAHGHNPKGGIDRRQVPTSKVCEVCGRTYARSELKSPQSNKHWLVRRFCGEVCRRAWAKTSQPTGEASPHWKGDDVGRHAGGKRARQLYPVPQPCEWPNCEKLGSDRHHIDGNPINNAPENISFLCRKHHIETEDRLSYRRLPPGAVAERKRRMEPEYHRRWLAKKRAKEAENTT